ncbi:MAG TPA: nodulation protein NfeD [Vicinamibacterales bacterium]|jgi:membrane-bound serine protease (ClpP class)|nr:nodulation protein NfeD [Vicinamibacterales bacterium]
MSTTRLLTACGLIVAAISAAAARERAPIVETAVVDGIIHPVTSEFMRSAIAKADADGASVIVFTLQTPGGLLDSTRDIINAMIGARTPVVVFVGPAGNRAASAGFLITIAADVAAMAPGTHIGAAHPVSGTGEKVDEVMAKKMASDTAAYARTLAAQRGRNVPLVEQAVTESRSFTEQEAIAAAPPLVDLIATDVTDLIRKLDGRTVRRFNGTTTKLALANADVRTIDMTLAQRVLSAVAHPQIAYLLLTLGTLGLTIELWSPGAILPGVAGGIALLLAFFALQVLPVSSVGLLLMLLGFALLVIEVKVTSHGLLAVGGITSLLFGSLMLIDSPLPEMQIGLRLILPITLALSGIILFLVRLGVKAQAQPAVTGESGMLHAQAQALTTIDPGGVGRVATHGEIWTATAAEPISAGDRVVVTDVKGLLLTVRRP